MQPIRIFFYATLVGLLSMQGLTAYTLIEAEQKFWKHNEPTQPLKTLFKMEHITYPQSFSSLVDQLQKEWLRPSNKERWQLEDTPYQNAHRAEYFKIFDALDLTSELKPTFKQWDYVVIPGSLAQEFRKRMEFGLKQNFSRHSPKFIILTGSRKTMESEKEYMRDHFKAENINSEPDCAKAFSEQLIGKKFNYTIVSYDTHSETIRATTEDTIKEWLLHHSPSSKKFRCLIVSSQPSAFHQLFVAYNTARNLGYEIEWDLIAPQNETPYKIIKVYLDNIARVFFGLRKIFNEPNNIASRI